MNHSVDGNSAFFSRSEKATFAEIPKNPKTVALGGIIAVPCLLRFQKVTQSVERYVDSRKQIGLEENKASERNNLEIFCFRTKKHPLTEPYSAHNENHGVNEDCYKTS